MLPNLLIVGAQKAGTFALWQALGKHPEVFMSPKKEPRFFYANQGYENGLDYYASFFEGHRGQKIVGEASPHYLYYPPAAERIAKALPDAKIIIMLRDPAARAYSQYRYNVWWGREPSSFSSAIRKEPERLKLADKLRSNFLRWDFSYVDKGRYATQVERYLALFQREQLLILRSEDFVQDPQTNYVKVCRFLEIEPQPYPSLSREERNETPSPRSLRLQLVANSITYGTTLAAYKTLGWKWAARTRNGYLARGIHTVTRRWNVSQIKPPAISDSDRQWIDQELAEDKLKLAGMSLFTDSAL